MAFSCWGRAAGLDGGQEMPGWPKTCTPCMQPWAWSALGPLLYLAWWIKLITCLPHCLPAPLQILRHREWACHALLAGVHTMLYLALQVGFQLAVGRQTRENWGVITAWLASLAVTLVVYKPSRKSLFCGGTMRA